MRGEWTERLIRPGSLDAGHAGRREAAVITGALFATMGAISLLIALFGGDEGRDANGSLASLIVGFGLIVGAGRMPWFALVISVGASLVASPVAVMTTTADDAGHLVALNAIVTIVWACSFLRRDVAVVYGTLYSVGTALAFIVTPRDMGSASLGLYFLFAALVSSGLTIRIIGELEDRSLRDPLTGLGNRRRWNACMTDLIRASDRQLSVVLIDLDHFKEVNDTQGHAEGDRVLVEVARFLDSSIPGVEAFRWGGDEFILPIPDVDGDAAQLMAEGVRARAKTQLNLGFSVGVAARLAGEALDVTVSRADMALYSDKASRRRSADSGDGRRALRRDHTSA